MYVTKAGQKEKIRRAPIAFCLAVVIFTFTLYIPQKSYACPTCPPSVVAASSATAQGYITQYFTQLQMDIQTALDKAFEDYLNFKGSKDGSFLDFFSNTLYEARVEPALQNFSKQMSAITFSQTAILGMFFDAEQQLNTKRLYQELHIKAHQDYQPSKGFCTFGTNVRSLATAEALSNHTKLALSTRQIKRHLGSADEASSESNIADKKSRWDQFANTYCDIHDNGWDSEHPDNTGLAQFCNTAGASDEDAERINIDIDYTRLVDDPRTLNIRLSDDTVQKTEQDIMALGNNLFGHDVISRDFNIDDLNNEASQRQYMLLRGIAAKRNVAENSFNSIVALKTAGSETADVTTASFLGSALKELGITDDEVYKIIGENPSYYAQLEILAKKLYQSPDFFIGLYDKPANVLRKSVAMKAIKHMLDREIYKSQARQEMTMSVLLSTEVNEDISETKGLLTPTER